MTIFRGVGGGGNSTTDSEITLLTSLAAEASASATLAGLSSTASGVSAGNAAASEAGVALSASNAATSASTSVTQASNASTSASAASASASTASTQATNASNSATAASGSASTASTQASNASTSASGASTSASNAATSASTASTQASNAASSASGASTSATNASNSATAASGSASTASTQASNASSSASAAATSASNASTSATNAANSATAAANSAASVPDDATLVHKTGNETIAGIKTFSSAPSLAGATLTGTVAGGGNQLNNVIIGATTPLAGSFTTVSATGALTTAAIKEVSGNVGIGVVPSAWSFTGNFDLGNDVNIFAGTNALGVGINAYFSGGWKYKGTGAASFAKQTGGAHQWHTAPSGTAGAAVSFTQAMTLDSAGNLLVGATSGSAKGYFLQNGVGSSIQTGQNYASFAGTAVNIRVSRDTSNGTYNFIGCTRDGVADVLFVRDSGNVVNTNNSYGAISDIKLKENITDASPKLAQLNKVRVVNYNLKTEPKHKQLGVVAQELEAIFPGMVEESPDREEQTKTREVEVYAVEEVKDEDGNVTTKAFPATTRTEEYTEQVDLGTVTKTVKYSVFVPMLIKAMQEQQAMIEALTDRLTALEAK